MMPILDVQNLTKKYRSVTAVDSVSFTVEPGEVFGMIGPNGAGKTTTIECALGLRRPTEGHVHLLEMDPSTERRKLFTRVGVQLQETAYQEHIRVREICSAIACMYERPVDWREMWDDIGRLRDDGVTLIKGVWLGGEFFDYPTEPIVLASTMVVFTAIAALIFRWE